MSSWTPYAREYDPLAAGSIDGTDTQPHDRAVVRAMRSNYVPPDVTGEEHSLFVARLPHNLRESKLQEKFSCFGKIESVRIIRDVVTGRSKGYGFVEFCHKDDAIDALHASRGMEIEGQRILVDKTISHKLKGWVPRRLGGGFGGRKEAGQLRFGCLERPWKKPIVLEPKKSSYTSSKYPREERNREGRDIERERERSSEKRDRERYSSSERNRDRHRRDHPDRRRERDQRRERSPDKDYSGRHYEKKREKYSQSEREYERD